MIFVAFFQKIEFVSLAMRAPMIEVGCSQLAPTLDVALVVGRHRACVEDVEQIEPDIGARAASRRSFCRGNQPG